MNAVKYFVTKEGQAFIECPKCKQGQSISVAAYKGKNCAIINCPCGHSFEINLDFREHFRKKIVLEGNYRKTGLNIETFYTKLPVMSATSLGQISGEKKNCVVKDLSFGGIGLDIWGSHSIVKGDELFVEFNLNNKIKTLIRCKVIVKSVHDNYVGVEFKEQSDYCPELGFYLLS